MLSIIYHLALMIIFLPLMNLLHVRRASILPLLSAYTQLLLTGPPALALPASSCRPALVYPMCLRRAYSDGYRKPVISEAAPQYSSAKRYYHYPGLIKS